MDYSERRFIEDQNKLDRQLKEKELEIEKLRVMEMHFQNELTVYSLVKSMEVLADGKIDQTLSNIITDLKLTKNDINRI